MTHPRPSVCWHPAEAEICRINTTYEHRGGRGVGVSGLFLAQIALKESRRLMTLTAKQTAAIQV